MRRHIRFISSATALALCTVAVATTSAGALAKKTITCYQANETKFNAAKHPTKPAVRVSGAKPVCPANFTTNKYVNYTGRTLHVADQQGFYQLFWNTGIQAGVIHPNQLGFTVHFDELTGPSIIAAVIHGSDDLTSVVSTASWAEALDAGQSLTAVGVNQLVNPQKYWQVLVSAASYSGGLTSAANLAGKKIAYSAGDSSQYVVDSLLHKNHIPLNGYTFENVSESNALSALLTGSVDAIVVSPITAAQAVANGAHVIANGSGIFNGYEPILMTPAGTRNPKTMAMVSAYLYQNSLINRWILDHKAEFTTVIFNAFFASTPSLNNAIGQGLASVLYTAGVNRFTKFTSKITSEMQAESEQLYYDGVLQNRPRILSNISLKLNAELAALSLMTISHN